MTRTPGLKKAMATKSSSLRGKMARVRKRGSGSTTAGSNAVPFMATAFAARVFEPPAISDVIEDEPVFDKSKSKRVVKTRVARAS